MISTLNIYQIPLNQKGKIAIISRPRGEDLLEESIEFLKKMEVQNVVSALTKEEERELGLESEKKICEEYNIAFFQYPIEDRGVPVSIDSFDHFCKPLSAKIQEGMSIGVHCRAGIGRSTLISSCILIQLGFTSEYALELISKSRNVNVPDTIEQKKWIEEYSNFKQGKLLRGANLY